MSELGCELQALGGPTPAARELALLDKYAGSNQPRHPLGNQGFRKPGVGDDLGSRFTGGDPDGVEYRDGAADDLRGDVTGTGCIRLVGQLPSLGSPSTQRLRYLTLIVDRSKYG